MKINKIPKASVAKKFISFIYHLKVFLNGMNGCLFITSWLNKTFKAGYD